MAAGLLILKYVTHELSYDDFHEQGDQIYRVRYDFMRDGERVFKSATAFPRVGPAMTRDFPEVEDYARLYFRYGGGVVRVGERSFKEDLLFQADPSFLTLFSYPMLRGDRLTALDEPGTAVISAEAARKYFGDDDPLGQRIRFGNNEEYEITGVIDSPENSHLKFDFLLSYATLVQQWGEDFDTAWGWYDFYTYVRLRPGTDADALAAKLPEFVARNGEGQRQNTVFILQPLRDIHLYSDLIQEARVNGDGTAVYFLATIALFILVIAWVNYINLATARAAERAREIGIRKAVGANRRQLVRQFILESTLLNLLAAGLALGLMALALPFFNNLAGVGLRLGLTGDPRFWAALCGLFCAGAFLSGLYPAFVLSSYKPTTVLKGKPGNLRQGLTLRKALVVGQFAASVGLIAGTLVVYQQLSFMRGQDLGIDIDQTLVINGPGVIASDSVYAEQMAGFKEELARHAAVRSVAASTEIPGNLIYWTSGARKLAAPVEQTTIMYQVGIDYDYLDAYGHRLLAGRAYTRDFTADDAAIVLNEAAIDVLGFPGAEQAVGQDVIIGGDTLQVVGVVANYHQEGLQKGYDQTAFRLLPAARSYYSVKVHTADLAGTVGFIGEAYERFFPENPFNHFFLDGFFDRQYQTDRQFGRVFAFFALLAIFIAALGLFGLASFTAAQRTKEIGIRKVLGSTMSGILILLSRDFVKLVLIASVIALPVVWLLMDRWLAGFAFRIDLSPWTFAAAALLTLGLALLTVSYQALRAAAANPVDSLRYE
jgi:putative ABC transport system permease protein